MITGAHFLLYSKDAEQDRAFFRDVLAFSSVDAGGGWLIFALPPSELAVHPGSGNDAGHHGELYLMCDDLDSTIRDLNGKNIVCAPVTKAAWGRKTIIPLPSGGAIGLYQPAHPTAIHPQ